MAKAPARPIDDIIADERERLFERMLSAVRKTGNSALEQRLTESWQSYDGDVFFLKKFLEIFGMGDYNPYAAASRAEPIELEYHLPAKRKRKGRRIAHGTASGGLTQQLIVLANKEDRTMYWTSGVQSILKIMEFCNAPEMAERLSPEGAQKLSAEKDRMIREASADYSTCIGSAVSEERTAAGAGRRVRLVGLRDFEYLESMLKRVDSVLYGETAFAARESPEHPMSLDAGGSLMGWLGKEFRQERLPEDVADDYTALNSRYKKIGPEEAKARSGRLLLYAAMKRPMKRDVLIGKYQQDLEVIMSLPDDDPLIQRYGKPELLSVRHILERSDITLFEALQVMHTYPKLKEIRAESNRRYYEKVTANDGFREVIERLAPLFTAGGKYKPDCYSGSVPMSRLSESVFSLVLSRDDFSAVQELLWTGTISPDDERFFLGFSMQQFRKTLGMALLAARKTAYMDSELMKNCIAAGDEEHAKDAVEKAKDEGIFKIFNESQPRLEEDFESEYGISLEEFINRAENGYITSDTWLKHSERIKKEQKFGLYSRRLFKGKKAEKLIADAKELIPYHEVREKIEEAVAAASHVLVKDIRYSKFQDLNRIRQYVRKETVDAADMVLEARARIDLVVAKCYDEAEAQGIEPVSAEEREKEVTALAERKKVMHRADFYKGSVSGSVFVRALGYFNCVKEPEAEEEINGISIMDPLMLKQALDSADEEYARIGDLPIEWLRKAKYVTSFDAESLLQKIGMKASERRTWMVFKELDHQEHAEHRIAREFAAGIETVYSRLEKALDMEWGVIRQSSKEALEQGMLYDRFVLRVKGTKPAVDARGVFSGVFPELAWDGEEQVWISRKELTKEKIGELSLRLRDYNLHYKQIVMGNEYPVRRWIEVERA